MNTKQVVIATLSVGILAMWFFGGEDEPVAPTEPPPHQASRQPVPVVPSQPRSPEPRFDYGIARQPWQQGHYPNPGLQAPSPGAWGEMPYQTDAWSDTRGYQFRPLNEGDRRRMGAPETAPYRTAPQAAAPAAPYGSWGAGQYGFRPSTPGAASGGRYENPSQMPSWGPGPDYAEQWDLPPWQQPEPAPQPSWAPPARRMLPSLDSSSTRTFTAR